jgi:antitoxin component YwqK of YwqJK toxin-antitoxin module
VDKYVTPIPVEAHEVIRQTWDNGTKKLADYFLGGQSVGFRAWNEAGQLVMERGLRDNQSHGLFRTWYNNGQLQEVAWYEHGKEHGTTEQYDETGKLIGTYTMRYGTGIDLWFAELGVLAEERYYQDGKYHGYERWWQGDNQTIWQESHFWHGVEHGIFRQWNQAGRLRRGYPRYFVAGERVSKRHYERACRHDSTLPPFRIEENSPARQLPEEVQQMAQIHKPVVPS